MTDVVDKKTRSRMMSGIKGKDTKPELLIRKALFALGFRYKLHDKNLPGKPDLVFPQYNAIIFIHGCFWHRHDCHLFRWPKTRSEFWKKKISGNVQTDQKNFEALKSLGWRIMTVWECSLKGKTKLEFSDIVDHIEEWLLGEREYDVIQGI